MAGQNSTLTVEQLHELLSYDPDTGKLTWLSYAKGKRKDLSAGYIDLPHGYVKIGILGQVYRAHRIIWLFCFGEWPIGEIDHINNVRHDNRLENLRDVSSSVNQQNLKVARSTNKCGMLGVRLHLGKWDASINVDGKPLHIGRYDSAEQAHECYLTAKRLLHPGCTI